MYDFRTLSPVDFEELVRDLLQAEFNVRCESFGPGKDQGIDCRFATSLGGTIVQAKHYIASGPNALLNAAAAEVPKIAKLKPQRYIFATSVSLTPALKDKILTVLSAVKVSPGDVLGQADLNNLLGRHPSVEQKHFKLWLASTAVLERILHNGVYNRTDAEMGIIKAMVPKFVHNDSVPAAEARLSKYGALIIAGEPGVGKSTLARMLVWLHAAQDWRIFVVDDMKEAFEVASTTEKRLVFFDDFLGQVRLSDDLLRGMDQKFPPFFQRVRSNKNLRFVLTTRDYIFQQAQGRSSRLSGGEIDASKFVLSVGGYTRNARAKMLFNHIYFGTLSAQEKDELLAGNFFLRIIDHRNFNPRLINVLTSAEYLSVAGQPLRETVIKILDNPHELWEKPYRFHISDEGRALMLAMFFNRPRTSIDELENTFQRIVEAMGLHFTKAELIVRFRLSLKELEGSIFAIRERKVSFSNPGVRDYLESAIREDRFLHSAVEVVRGIAEVEQAWSSFIAAEPHPGPLHPMADAWAGAAERLQSDKSGSPLERLSLAVEMYDRFQSDAFVGPAVAATKDLEEYEIEAEEVDRAKRVLEALICTLLPLEVQGEAQAVLSEQMGRLIAENAWLLNMDDLTSAADTLSRYGVDHDNAKLSIAAGVKGYVHHMGTELGEIRTEDELDQYRDDFNAFLEEHGLDRKFSTQLIERRRQEILEQDEFSSSYYDSPQLVSSAENSTAHICSLFNSLLK